MRATIRGHADVLFLVLVVLLIGGANLYWSAHDVAVNQAAQAHQAAVNQAAERRTAQAFERKLCQSFAELAALEPPAGNPATNPARAFDQNQHSILVGIGADIGCTGKEKA